MVKDVFVTASLLRSLIKTEIMHWMAQAHALVEYLGASFVFFFITRTCLYIGGPIGVVVCFWLHTPLSIMIGFLTLTAALCIGGFDLNVTYGSDLRFEDDVDCFLYRRHLLKTKSLVDFNIGQIGGFSLFGRGRFYQNANFGDSPATVDWLKANMTGEYGIVPVLRYTPPEKVWFENENDAVLFKLVWG